MFPFLVLLWTQILAKIFKGQLSEDLLKMRCVCRAWNEEATKEIQDKNINKFFLPIVDKTALRRISELNPLLESPDGNFPAPLTVNLCLLCEGETCPTEAEAAEWTLTLGRLLANLSPRLEQLHLNFSHAACSVQLLDVLTQARIESLSFPRLWLLHLSKSLPCTNRKPEPESKALFEVGEKLIRLAPGLKDLSISWQPLLKRELAVDEVLPEDKLFHSLPPKIQSLRVEKTFSPSTGDLLALSHLPQLRALSLSILENSSISESGFSSVFQGVSPWSTFSSLRLGIFVKI
jgi:hypothetical protein